jgi:hypothetical protein
MDIGGGGLLGEEGEAHVHPPNAFPTNVGGASGWQMFYGGMENIYEEEGLSEEESDGGDFDNGGGIKYTYCDATWKQDHLTYDPKPRDFIGVSEPTRWWNQMPTMM